MRLHVLDLDSSVAQQPIVRELAAQGRAHIVDLRDEGPRLRVIASRADIRRLIEKLDREIGPLEGEPAIYFYGSGDFHHVTAALLARVTEPLTVVHFDNHPDWCRFPATFNCGAWVNRALELPHVRKVVTLGPCSNDFRRPEWQTDNLPAIVAGRLEVYPWQVSPSRVWSRYPDTPCWHSAKGWLHWRNLADTAWPGFVLELAQRLPSTALWITIDKDVLGPAEATTNWDQGRMTLAHLEAALMTLASRRRIAGVDICGDYSTPIFSDFVRAFIARLDNPPGAPPSETAMLVNEATNTKLISCLDRLVGRPARDTASAPARDR